MYLPFYKHSYQETVYQSLSFLWTEACQGMHTHVQQRMEAMENCESLPNDILGMIIRASHSDNGFDMEALVDKFMTFFIAGQDTTANQLSFALFETLLNNEIENWSVINPWHC